MATQPRPEPETVLLKLDGREVTARADATILEAMQAHQQSAPTLCHDPRLDPYGGCRTCVVEVEGMPRPVPSCATKVAEGMEVRSGSERIDAHRKTLTELLMMEHLGGRGDGVGHDDLEVLAREYDVEPIFRLESHREPYEDRNEFIGLDPDNCILCNRCVRYCDEVMMCSALTLTAKGAEGRIQPTGGESFLDTDCELCGGCVSTCPTGALYDKRALGTKDEELEKTTTTCTYCGVGCQLDLHVADNDIKKVGTKIGAPVSEGNLCVKGRFAFDFVDHLGPSACALSRVSMADKGGLREPRKGTGVGCWAAGRPPILLIRSGLGRRPRHPAASQAGQVPVHQPALRRRLGTGPPALTGRLPSPRAGPSGRVA